jgi:hypothetical protein
LLQIEVDAPDRKGNRQLILSHRGGVSHGRFWLGPADIESVLNFLSEMNLL